MDEGSGSQFQNLAAVFECLESAGICVKCEKCSFIMPEVEYLGHCILAKGIHPVPKKVSAVREAPTPKDVSQLRSFLDLVN